MAGPRNKSIISSFFVEKKEKIIITQIGGQDLKIAIMDGPVKIRIMLAEIFSYIKTSCRCVAERPIQP